MATTQPNYVLSHEVEKGIYVVRREENPTSPPMKDRIRVTIPLHWKEDLREGPYISAAFYLLPQVGEFHSHPRAPETIFTYQMAAKGGAFVVQTEQGKKLYYGNGAHMVVPAGVLHQHIVREETFHSAVKPTENWERKINEGRALKKGEWAGWVEGERKNGVILAPNPIYRVMESFGSLVKAWEHLQAEWRALWPIEGSLRVGKWVLRPFDLLITNRPLEVKGDGFGYGVAWNLGAVP